jgi:hypothetical protein
MTIRRQYSLPNCTLVLEGLSNEMAQSDPQTGRPLLSIVVNAECQFVGTNKKLHGGRVFLENLVKAVSAYAQECLSGVRHPQERQEGSDRVHLEKIQGTNLHRLTWQPPKEANEQPVEMELTSVQLFDLIESVDQFVADSRTLPDLSLKLQPVSRRYRQPDEPFAQRVIPATVGMMGLALTAFVFFLIPVPQVRQPQESKPQASPTETVPSTQQSSPASPPATNPTPSNP